MQQAYDTSQDAQGQYAPGDAPVAPPQISPELKDQFDQQVKQYIGELGSRAAAGPGALAPAASPDEPEEMPDALRPGHIIFRVVEPLEADVAGETCSLNRDDWVVRTGDLDQDGTVAVRVATSRTTECQQGALLHLPVNNLMTMEAEQDQQIQAALKTVTDTLGRNGLPAGPANGARPFPAGMASPDGDVATSLQREVNEAAGDEAAVVAASNAGGM
jgi:hypothetical protein